MDCTKLTGMCLAMLAAAGPALAGTYVVTTLGSNALGYLNAPAINDNDQVAYSDTVHGYLWSAGVTTQIDYSGTNVLYTILQGVNNSGLVTGYAAYQAQNQQVANIPFTYDWTSGTFATVKVKAKKHGGSTNAVATEANSSGAVLGFDTAASKNFVAPASGKVIYYGIPHGLHLEGSPPPESISDAGIVAIPHAALQPAKKSQCSLYSGTEMIDSFTFPVGTDGPCAISLAGTVFGTMYTGGGTPVSSVGYIYNAGNITTIQYPGYTYTTANAINASGEITGTFGQSPPADGPSQIYVEVDGSFYPINIASNAVSVSVNGINALGSLVGVYSTTDNQTYVFIAQCPANQGPCTQ